MSITLTYAATDLSLPADLIWTDEHGWSAVEQRREYTITGALIVEAAAKQAGRSITLEGGEDFGWIAREDLATLTTWAALAGQVFTLNLHGVDRDVVFDHEGGPIQAAPIQDFSDPADDDRYSIVLRLIEV